MLTRTHANRGFTLVELLVGIAIATILVTLALPGYTSWIADGQNRDGAESIASGLRYAKAQAIERNDVVRFVFNPAAGVGGWQVQLDSTGAVLQAGSWTEGANKSLFAPSPGGATKVTYSGLGRIVANTDASATLYYVKVTNPSASAAPHHTLSVCFGNGAICNTGVGIKICDTDWPATDPKGCPV